jgi:hypothetical protein
MQDTQTAAECKPVADAPRRSKGWEILVDVLLFRAQRLIDVVFDHPDKDVRQRILKEHFEAAADLIDAAAFCGRTAMILDGHIPRLLAAWAAAPKECDEPGCKLWALRDTGKCGPHSFQRGRR